MANPSALYGLTRELRKAVSAAHETIAQIVRVAPEILPPAALRVAVQARAALHQLRGTDTLLFMVFHTVPPLEKLGKYRALP